MTDEARFKTDRRVRRTHHLLRQALVELALERNYDKVTIRDITERADVGYATFFRHYPDKDALLSDVVHTMKDDFRALLEPFSMVTDPQRTGELLFRYVGDNQDVCRVLLHSVDIFTLLHPVHEIGLQEAAPLLQPSAGSSTPVELAADHLITSLLMLIRWWLDHEMPYPPEQMGQIAARLIIAPVVEAFR